MGIAMKNLIEDAFGRSPLDAGEAARAAMRTPARKRFYREAAVVPVLDGGWTLALDGKSLHTPQHAALVLPHRELAEAVAAEWNAQGGAIEPGSMPLTRLANSIIDGVAHRMAEVAADILNFAGTDMVFYRADGPQALIDRQASLWDPVIDWASQRFGGRFVLAEGIVHVAQPQAALEGIRAALPSDPWPVGALHLATTLTGSALIALALAAGRLDPEAAWSAAYVDEDWNAALWGADEAVLEKRAARFADLQAAARVLRLWPMDGGALRARVASGG